LIRKFFVLQAVRAVMCVADVFMVLNLWYWPHECRYVEGGTGLGILYTICFLNFERALANGFVNGAGFMIVVVKVRLILWRRIHEKRQD
jgi:hypothetical protein